MSSQKPPKLNKTKGINLPDSPTQKPIIVIGVKIKTTPADSHTPYRIASTRIP
jgi:hypothetical protein